MTFYCLAADGTVYEVPVGTYVGGHPAAVEAVGPRPGPADLRPLRQQDRPAAVQCGHLPGRGAGGGAGHRLRPRDAGGRHLPAGPHGGADGPAPCVHHRPRRLDMDGAGAATYFDLHSQLWDSPFPSPSGTVIVPTDAPLDEETAYTVTFSDPETGDSSPGPWTRRASAGSTASRATAAGCHQRRLPARLLLQCAGHLLPGQPHRPKLRRPGPLAGLGPGGGLDAHPVSADIFVDFFTHSALTNRQIVIR